MSTKFKWYFIRMYLFFLYTKKKKKIFPFKLDAKASVENKKKEKKIHQGIHNKRYYKGIIMW